MPPKNGAARPPSGPDDVPLVREELRARLTGAEAAAVAVEVVWMTSPLPGFKVTLREADRTEVFGIPTRVLAADRDGRTLDKIVADALRRLRR
jgi:hypothetical protein